jgi:CheY-like chemotaxis protein
MSVSYPARTVLYIEDNKDNLALVAHLLARREDLTLFSATDGKAGVEMAFTLQPDVILMDINMPVMGGMEALELLLNEPATARIPVIALSCHAYPAQIQHGLEAGFYGYLTKPFKFDEFLAALDAALNDSSMRPIATL